MEGNYVNMHKGERFGFEEHSWGSSWPARNYACSFCKREFKSAQALGGHMNVHRRDRARLRSSLPSSWVSESPKPNPCIKPNPTHPSPSSSSSFLSNKLLNCEHISPLCSPSSAFSSSLTQQISSNGDKKPRLLPLSGSQSEEIKMSKNTGSGLGVQGCAIGEEHKSFNFKSNEHSIKLELGIGLLKQPKEKLDLELRLGHF
ncbi:hypothetical protein Fmac_029994 [Flemingia macrophylla]|uniref:C2H2-type domain-containing protein n=1 Tax=Flemingia macrophylla TaxID=520843 RepID=A0ABD1LBX6_9FABA